MSSLPGYTLEAFVAWNYDLTVDDLSEANPSLGIAQALGNIPTRKHLTREHFATLVSYFESHREQVEYLLLDFDEDNQSWRAYAGDAFDFIPDATYTSGQIYIDSLLKES